MDCFHDWHIVFIISHLQATVSRTEVGSVSRGTSWPLLAMGYPSRPSLALQRMCYFFSFPVWCTSIFSPGGVFVYLLFSFLLPCTVEGGHFALSPFKCFLLFSFLFVFLWVWCLGVVVPIPFFFSFLFPVLLFLFLFLKRVLFAVLFFSAQLVCLGPFWGFSVSCHLFLSFFSHSFPLPPFLRSHC